MRLLAIMSHLAFIVYAVRAGLPPVLLPLNAWRLAETLGRHGGSAAPPPSPAPGASP